VTNLAEATAFVAALLVGNAVEGAAAQSEPSATVVEIENPLGSPQPLQGYLRQTSRTGPSPAVVLLHSCNGNWLRLDERWGKASFWCWFIGFYLAFMPLYVLGLLGMTRRMQHYDNLAWQPWLVVAAIGAVVILAGILCQVVQLVVSIRARNQNRDVTGDPWNGRTLEWSTASPPPANARSSPGCARPTIDRFISWCRITISKDLRSSPGSKLAPAPALSV